MQLDDDVAIDVDEALDQLTELLVIPDGSPVHAVRRAIVLSKPQRPALIVMPEDASSTLAERATSRAMPRRPGARRMRLTPFAPRLRS
ncbi:MAG TPA: hypothetical protein VFX59_05365 [Polyangiales bacterium]|nr:hypothetical protein [Polyangiales bacterium]